MTSLIYLLQRTIINSLKELVKKPLKLILYVFMVIILGATIFFSVKGNGPAPTGSLEAYKSIFLLAIIGLLFISLKTGIDKGNTLFRLSDANFIFTAPIRSQVVLFYGFIKEIGSNFIVVLLLIFQIPNLYNIFPIKDYGWIIIIGGTFIFLVFSSIMSVLLYSIGTINHFYKKLVKYCLYGLTGLVVLGLIYNIITLGDPLKGGIEFFNMKFFTFIPIIGWFLNIYTSAILGFNLYTGLYLTLIIVSGGLFLLIIYNLDLDYYEEALNFSITKEEQIAIAKSGKVAWNGSSSKVRKAKDGIKSYKSKAILSKQILEGRKKGLVFIDKTSLIISAFVFVFTYFISQNEIGFLLFMLVYMNILFSVSKEWTSELEKHYIYLIPERSTVKIIYATMLENIKSLVTGLVIFTAAIFLYDITILNGLVLALTYTSFTAVVLFSDLVIRRILGIGISITAEKFIKFISLVLIFLPGIILSVIGGTFINPYTLGQGMYLILILYNLLISLFFIFLSKGIFEKIDMR